jgi:ADP-ribose pyrophosphatase YjhB (NUDIX family)
VKLRLKPISTITRRFEKLHWVAGVQSPMLRAASHPWSVNMEPQKFFIGVIDLFSVLMPGALLACVINYEARQTGSPAPNITLGDSERWVVFVFASYLLGHLAFLVGATIDSAYGVLRSGTELGQTTRLAKGKRLSSSWLRRSARTLFPKQADAALVQALRMKVRSLRRLSAEGSINTFQWCKARLSKEHPDGLAAVQRFEADSKFFRSFVVVLTALAILYASTDRLPLAAACLAALVFALWRYQEQRFKATQQAYWFVLTLEGMKDPPPAADVSAGGAPTHAGGIVFRTQNGGVGYLVVEASGERSKWVLPKGHIEAGEAPREAAVREVKEEANVWARIIDWVDDVRLGAVPGAPLVRFFLMEALEEGAPLPPEERQRRWLTRSEATADPLLFVESKDLIGRADAIRTGGRRSPASATTG